MICHDAVNRIYERSIRRRLPATKHKDEYAKVVSRVVCTKGPLILVYDNNGRHEHGPLRTLLNTIFEHMGLSMNPYL